MGFHCEVVVDGPGEKEGCKCDGSNGDWIIECSRSSEEYCVNPNADLLLLNP